MSFPSHGGVLLFILLMIKSCSSTFEKGVFIGLVKGLSVVRDIWESFPGVMCKWNREVPK